MRTSSRFTVAIHIASIIAITSDSLCTSEYIAGSVNTNPVVIRRLIGKLKIAGILAIYPGGGAYLAQNPEDITLLALYQAVEQEPNQEIFQFHDQPNPACLVGANLQSILEVILLRAQSAMESVLAEITLADITSSLCTTIQS